MVQKEVIDSAKQLDNSFEKDKVNIWAIRAWFMAMADKNECEPKWYQIAVAHALVWLRPFRQEVDENARVITLISQQVPIPNLEAIRSMLKEIENSLNIISKHYKPPQELVIDGRGVPSWAKEVIRNNTIVAEVNDLRRMVEEVTDIKNLTKLVEDNETENHKTPSQTLKSIHLITKSLEPTDTIWMVLNGLFEIPIRFSVRNRSGRPTAMKKLYDIAYCVDAPNKTVSYDTKVADGINNGIFKKREVARFMKTNRLGKPTLVQRSEDGKILVLKNEVPVKADLIKNIVPPQHKPLYIDKTR